MEQPARRSRKREAILAVIRSTDVHPSADWVYQTLKPQYPDLSLGTIYRNLSRFKAEGLVASVGTVNGQERFDGVVVPHAHFVCKCCGAVQDLPRFPMDTGLDRAAEQYGVKVDQHELTFRGTCATCLQKSPIKEES